MITNEWFVLTIFLIQNLVQLWIFWIFASYSPPKAFSHVSQSRGKIVFVSIFHVDLVSQEMTLLALDQLIEQNFRMVLAAGHQ